jgi:hypothetical protein
MLYIYTNNYIKQKKLLKRPSIIPAKVSRIIGAVIAFFLFCFPVLKAQDTIVKRNGERIAAKIISVNPDNIKYRRSDNPEGPLFGLNKWDLNYIVYPNGMKESFESIIPPVFQGNYGPDKQDLTIQPSGDFYYFQRARLHEQHMLDIAWKLKDKKINLMINSTEQKKVVKNCFLFGGLALDLAGLLTYVGAFSPTTGAAVGRLTARQARRAVEAKNHEIGGYMIAGGLSCELVSVIYHIQETRNAHLVVDLYNNSISQ